MLNQVESIPLNEEYTEQREESISEEKMVGIYQIEQETNAILRETTDCLFGVLKKLKGDPALEESNTRETISDLRTLCNDTNHEARVANYLADIIKAVLFSD